MFRFDFIFIELPTEGEKCSLCKQEIEDKKYQAMLDFGDPVNFLPKPLSLIICEECKKEWEK